MQPELRRYIQHISLSPDSINNDDVGTISLKNKNKKNIHTIDLFCLVLTPARSFSHMHPVNVTLLPGRRPSNEVLTRHDGHPHQQPCEGEPDEVITPPPPNRSSHDENCLIYFFFCRLEHAHTSGFAAAMSAPVLIKALRKHFVSLETKTK